MPQHLLERYDRQVRIQGWNQKRLSNTRIMVLGAGALGNEIVKNLALTGIGNLIIVDFDAVERSNLSRTVLFSENDLGKPKAATLAAAARKLNPNINVTSIHGDLLFDVGLGFYRYSDLIIGALDNLAARVHANTYAILADKPYMDCGIREFGGEVKWYFPSHPVCFECSLTEKDRNIIALRHSCTGFKQDDKDNPAEVHPTTLAPIAIIAGMATQEVCHFIFKSRTIKPGQATVYNGMDLTIYKSNLPSNSECQNHNYGPYINVKTVAYSTHNITAVALMELASKDLGSDITMELGKDYLQELYCEHCEEKELIYNLIRKIYENESLCPTCRRKRITNVKTALSNKDELSKKTLAELGIPPGEVVMLHSDKGHSFYELYGDITNLLNDN